MLGLPLYFQIALACLAGGVLSLFAAALVMFGLSRRWLAYAVSFSIGVLLATALLHLLPEALESGLSPHEAFPTLLCGILGFFALEKFAIWRHAHGNTDTHVGAPSCEDHTHEHHHAQGGEALVIVVGDGFHNFVDGLMIAAAFLADPHLGWLATAAVVAHEVPQEAGDFAILLAAGLSRARAFVWNGLSSLASLGGGVIGYIAFEEAQRAIPYLVTLAAASFVYIAIADLMPRLKREQRGILGHAALLALGIVTVLLLNGHRH
ncbi:MAG: ZIP family metal transporter [Rhodocyclaceae bacterium]|nr:ZIP family metal transporter [Rhodocyclaceae bacterium]